MVLENNYASVYLTLEKNLKPHGVFGDNVSDSANNTNSPLRVLIVAAFVNSTFANLLIIRFPTFTPVP